MKFWKTKIISKITKFHNRSLIFTFKSTRKRHDVYGNSQSSRPEFQHDQTAQSVEILFEEEIFFSRNIIETIMLQKVEFKFYKYLVKMQD